MARRSDHSKDELKALAIEAGQKIMAEEGFSHFSARKVAREIGYTIGTIYNIFESHDDLILHINVVTLCDIAAFVEEKTTASGKEAIKQMANAYIEFAQDNNNCWSALFEHRLPADIDLPDWYQAELNKIFAGIEHHFKQVITNTANAEIAAKTIWASIHGICQLSLTGKLGNIGITSIQLLTDSLITNYLNGINA